MLKINKISAVTIIILNLISLALRARPKIKDFMHTNIHLKIGIGITILFNWFFCQNIFAQELHATFVEWSVFSNFQANKKVCYIVSLPSKREGDYNKRGEPYFLVTNTNDGFDEISISSGYNYKKNSEVELSFGLKKFNIFTYDSLAWANDRVDDIEIVKSMRTSRDLVVSGIASDNTYSQDTYSLIGFMEAYKKMKEICKSGESDPLK